MQTWLLGACVMALAFGFAVAATEAVEEGDHSRVLTVVLVCALWPISIAVGIGLMFGDLFRAVRKAVRRSA